MGASDRDGIVIRGEWLTRAEVATRLGVSAVRVDQYAAEGRLQYETTKLGRLFYGPSVDALRAEREARQQPDTEQLSGGAPEPETSGAVVVIEDGA